MKFTYKEMYETKATVSLLSGLCPILLLRFFPFSPYDTTSLVAGAYLILSIVVALYFKARSVFEGWFAFFIMDDSLKIQYKKYKADFLWRDILTITENKLGFMIKTKKMDKHLFISNSLENYKTFKTMLCEKADKYDIPWILPEKGR